MCSGTGGFFDKACGRYAVGQFKQKKNEDNWIKLFLPKLEIIFLEKALKELKKDLILQKRERQRLSVCVLRLGAVCDTST